MKKKIEDKMKKNKKKRGGGIKEGREKKRTRGDQMKLRRLIEVLIN
jgi:hypothetical protein